MTIDPTLAQTTAILISWWQALLIAIPFIAWGWLIPRLEKDARYFHLNVLMWNAIHLAAGVAALAAMLAIPFFWVSWPVGVLILLGPVLAYWQLRNAAVPESHQFRLTTEGLAAKMESRRLARAARDVELHFIDAKGEGRQPAPKDDPLFQVQMLAEDLLGPALNARAGRVEVAVNASGCTVVQYVDGVKYKREPFAVEGAVRLIDYLKEIAGLDVSDRRRPGAGEFAIKSSKGTTSVHAVTSGSSTGQLLRLDFDREIARSKPFDGVGLLPTQMEVLKGLAETHDRHGIVLIGAPRGHGLSTTAYSLLGRHDAFTSNIKSLEKDIQVRLEGVDQVKFDATNPNVDYATTIQSILRRDPDVVLVADVADPETARVVSEPGLNGPLLYIPQPVGTIVEQIRGWVKLVGDVKQAVKPLRAVVNQRLLRSLCPNCRQGFEPSPEQLRKLNIPAGKVKQLYRAGGKIQVKNKIETCPVCSGTGYLGQTAAFEVMPIDDECRKILITGDLKAAMAHARRNKMIYLQEAALSKVVSGETTIEEVIRITAPSSGASKSPAAPAAASA